MFSPEVRFISLSSSVRTSMVVAIALTVPTIWSNTTAAQTEPPSDALYLEQTVQGVSLQNADSTALLRGDGDGNLSTEVGVNCQNYQGSDFINLDCLNRGEEATGGDLRWQRSPEDLLSPKGNRSDSLDDSPNDAGELKIFL